MEVNSSLAAGLNFLRTTSAKSDGGVVGVRSNKGVNWNGEIISVEEVQGRRVQNLGGRR